MISHDLESTPLHIKTDSASGSGEEVIVTLYDTEGEGAGSFNFKFLSPPQYYLGWCMTSNSDLPSTLPSEVNKVWVITKFPGPRITIQCNGVTVVDITMSDDTCSDSSWSKNWRRQVEQIRFFYGDTASDQYRAAPPGN